MQKNVCVQAQYLVALSQRALHFVDADGGLFLRAVALGTRNSQKVAALH